MPKFCWIDLHEAAVRLSSKVEDVQSLIDDGVLDTRSFDGSEFVVRSDDVERLADLFTFSTGRPLSRRRCHKPGEHHVDCGCAVGDFMLLPDGKPAPQGHLPVWKHKPELAEG